MLRILRNHHIAIYSFRATISFPYFTSSDLMTWAFLLSIIIKPNTKKFHRQGIGEVGGIECVFDRYRGFALPSFIDNVEDMQEPDSNDLMNRDNTCNHARKNIRHNIHQDSKVHSTDREPQSLRLRIRFDCRTLRGHTRLGLSIALLAVYIFSFILPFLLGDIGQAYSLNPFPLIY